MNQVEELVKDEQVKGIWCVPKYSNPTGITFSDETVRRFADLSPAAKDFRIFWDNAYAIHDLYEESEPLLNLYTELEKRGKTNLAYIFASFSKVTYAGGSVSMMASGKENMDYAKSIMKNQIICNDKINQLRHALFFKDAKGVRAHMKKHAALLRPKFEMVLDTFEKELAPVGVGRWTKPKGGYFISLDVLPGTAGRVYDLTRKAGVTLTTAGATYPYGTDPEDKNLRLAPTYPKNDDLRLAMKILVVAVKIAAIEKLLQAEDSAFEM